MLNIRYADICDAEELAKIHSSSWKIAYKGIGYELINWGLNELYKREY